MTEGDTSATAQYTDAARARLVMAYEACVLADLARAAVPIGEDELSPDGTTRTPGAVLADAARVLAAAQRYFEAAAVFELIGGADWQLIGDVLHVPARTARVRFAMAEAAFRKEVLHPEETGSAEAPDEAGGLRAYMAREPLEVALDLDDWVLRHEDGDSQLGTAPVSGGLTRKDPRRSAEKHS
ncbi:hypothetical protein Sipo8835_05920 [Streptomyces ipomoeae]|jgi:hypothetical protein|uniref:Uncharacterized protein n=2 Tax=Streptomyces ipomoeae TaxID=103232 RepID=L1KLV2_9ACTN|nr:hypothetical protein [Streptomyces ipomoeae]EKX61587.1 hypothetical protein STRIP9103_00178 [Streptomyces ipomoeae 91-03]MDX2693338.1 hypothetical protein [Streptomyces ipomoeae]MDX2820886.1 hypothetical protein [Streptomyces ipomoeae]MDX2838963.1 hypothetical protein [Streptomyces ipomoeae]MDX2873382.1 hypothetical protein [Streptomyces ipomoeae]